MSQTVHAIDFLESQAAGDVPPVCVIFGDEPFFKRLALAQVRRRVAGDDDDAPVAAFEGKTCDWRDVRDELSTVALFGGGTRRLAIVSDADDFVSKHRGRLEEYVERPKKSGVLVLVVGGWAANTRLYKAIDKSHLQIECCAPYVKRGKSRKPDEKRAGKWLASWSRQQHDAVLAPRAAELLLELVGPQFGLLDQGLAKLALFAGPKGKITPDMVQDIVGGWRTKTTWDLLDAAADGNAAAALQMLDRLLQAGDNPLALFGQIGWSLRRYAAATRIYEQSQQSGKNLSIRAALQEAGFKPWPTGALEDAERRLRQLGRQRAGALYGWLLEADLALKGSHSTPHRARLVLEMLIARMAKQLSPQAPAAAG